MLSQYANTDICVVKRNRPRRREIKPSDKSFCDAANTNYESYHTANYGHIHTDSVIPFPPPLSSASLLKNISLLDISSFILLLKISDLLNQNPFHKDLSTLLPLLE